MSDIQNWSGTDASNTSASPDGWPENMAPSGVNNGARAIQGAVRRLYSDWNGSLTSGGSSNAYTLTPNRTIAAYAAGVDFVFAANHANTGACTINVSALGAKDIRDRDGAALVSGDIESGAILHIVYDNSNGYFRATNLISALGSGASNLDSLSDVAISTATSGDLLRYNGSSWVNATLAASLTAASTTASGIVELATAAEALAGTSQTLGVTPYSLANARALLSVNGYYFFPGGFGIQWGQTSVTSSSMVTVTYPTAFTSGGAKPFLGMYSTVDRSPLVLGTTTNTIFEVYNPNAASITFNWVSFGY